MELCGQGRGSGSSPGKMLPCSCSMYPSWCLILIWSWILIRLRNGESMSPVQTFRIPAEPKRRRQVRITPSEKDTIYKSIPKKKLRFTLDTKRWAKAKKTQALGLQIQSGIQNLLQLKTFNNGTLLSSVRKKKQQQQQPYKADFTVDKAQPSYHWRHIWLLLLLYILIWTVSSLPILSCSSELYRETHKKVKGQ